MNNESEIFQPSTTIEYSNHLSDITPWISHNHTQYYRAKQYGRWYLLKTTTNPSHEAQCQLEKEFALGVQLDHPNIVHTLDIGFDEQLGEYIRFEWIDGCTLDEFLQTNPNPAIREKLIRQLLDAVGYLHQQQIVHRDLKPDNILVTRNGQNIKLIDFGLSDSDDYAVLKQPAGTLSYIAPEQLHEQQANCLSDIYSLGKLIARIRPSAHRCIVRKCIRQCPERRYTSCEQIVRAIQRQQRTQIWLPISLLFCVLVIFCAYLCYMAYFRPDPRETVIQQANELMQEQFNIYCPQSVSSPTELNANLTTFYTRAAVVRDSVAATIEDESLRYDFTNAAVITAGKLAAEYYEIATGVERE